MGGSVPRRLEVRKGLNEAEDPSGNAGSMAPMAGRKLTPLYVEPTLARWWDQLIIVLTIGALSILLVDMSLDPASRAAITLGWVDLGLCAFFMIDFALRFRKANDRWRFLRRNWADLLGAIPLVGPLRTARFIRVIRILRLTRIGALTYRLFRRYDLPFPGQTLGTLAIVTIAIWLAAAGSFYGFEEGVNEGIRGLDDALWWSMTTLSTVGYGDLYPETSGGRIVAVATMVLGVGVLGTLAATIATAFIDLRERGRRGTRSYMYSNHVLVLGWNDKSFVAIEELRQDARYRGTAIVVVAERDESPIDDGSVKFVRGAAVRQDPLVRASADRAAAAIVFARDPVDGRSDHETALVVHALRRMNRSARISAELVDPENKEHLQSAGCDAVIDLKGVASGLLVRSVLDAGVTDVVSELLTNTHGSQIYRIPLDDQYIGERWQTYASSMLGSRCTLLGVVRKGTIQVNPSADLELNEGDEVFVIAEKPPR